MKLPKKQCSSCPFLDDGIQLPMTKMLEIYSYLMDGTNHLCHSDRTDNTICVGGRNFQLQFWYEAGIISEPTNEALKEAMLKNGITPNDGIV
jgi:hypothetical protein